MVHCLCRGFRNQSTWIGIAVKWSVWLDTCQCHRSVSWILRSTCENATSSCTPPVVIMERLAWAMHAFASIFLANHFLFISDTVPLLTQHLQHRKCFAIARFYLFFCSSFNISTDALQKSCLAQVYFDSTSISLLLVLLLTAFFGGISTVLGYVPGDTTPALI